MAVPKFFFPPSLFLNSLFIDHLAPHQMASPFSSRLCKNAQSDKQHPPHNVWEMKMKRDAAAAKKRPCGILSDSFVSLLLGFVLDDLFGRSTHPPPTFRQVFFGQLRNGIFALLCVDCERGCQRGCCCRWKKVHKTFSTVAAAAAAARTGVFMWEARTDGWFFYLFL